MATTTLESEILKRNTDCVYFLASPLTCKKGSECEYRHNDVARLNPRDCWYWLSGNCLNPTCAFRHPELIPPNEAIYKWMVISSEEIWKLWIKELALAYGFQPLEGLTDASSSSVHVAHHSVITASKTNVPCYFYFNAYCMKGDQCPFSHVMDDISHAQKFPKIAPEATATHLPMNKACTVSDTRPAAVEIPSYFTDVISNPKELTYETPGKNVDDTTLNNISNEPSPSLDSPGSSNHDYEEPMAMLPDNPSPEEKYMNTREDSFSEHSSDELVKDHTEPEERWESSPGFDVLVDDVSEQLAYEDDADYLQVREGESGRLHNHLMHYDYEDSAAYDPMDYPDDGFVYDQCPYDAYEHFSDGYAPDYAGGVPEPSGKRRLDSMLHRKRRSLHKEWETEQHGVDLRDHLRKRRRMDVHLVSQDSRRCRPSHATSVSQECPESHGAYHGRLSSELGRELGGNRIRLSHREMESALDESHRMGNMLGHPYFGRQSVHSRNNELLGSLEDYNRRTKRLGHRDFGRPLAKREQGKKRKTGEATFNAQGLSTDGDEG
ncbi:hypothetical protein Taro_049575 [Colocasia esculenta]|uniref:C3H1-type domain-containing protein n=1 Tax=Colocasia esculenta TaxID=4460 RepID=A0A843XBE8_COLES|nr:hypothetical protein [Colocasia esculenta]